MFHDLPPIVVWLANVGGLAGMPILISLLFIRLPDRYFTQDGGMTKLLAFERSGKWYERTLAIHRWKNRLPDGGAWLKGGFHKKRLSTRDNSYMKQFELETRRGEWAHWCMLLVTPIFMLWNEGWSAFIVLVYALAANLPCIFVQRYNRARFIRLMFRRGEICYAKEMKSASMEEL
ncbi:glycosyl-4,4'-diaponeurosporenoate acyltransferase [Paenibacillus sp. sgz302251]|uniref:glycosyl-4,4'-diaponeurosporenoate acyltransferase CrtO family protein n=1 Tax=Paenibacillus sp. sgz302251 TaxID=3414493 RepID=UPI003C7A4152